MTVEEQLKNALLAFTGFTDIVGDRLYLSQLPQNPVFPCATYERITTALLYTMENELQGKSGTARFQIMGYCQGASSGAQAIALAEAVIDTMPTFNAAKEPGSPPTLGTPPNRVANWWVKPQPQTQPPLFQAYIDLRIQFNTFS